MCSPGGVIRQRGNDGSTTRTPPGSVFVNISPYFEQGVIYNNINFNLNMYDAVNTTVSGIGSRPSGAPATERSASRTSTALQRRRCGGAQAFRSDVLHELGRMHRHLVPVAAL